MSRKRLDVCLITEDGEIAGRVAAPPDADGLRGLVRRIAPCGEPVRAVIESMTGARFVHDTLEELGWDVEIADAQKVKGLAPLACKTDMIDAQVLAVLSHRDLVPAIWLPDPRVRREREQARFGLHLVKHKSSLKSRIHSTMITFGHPCPVTDLFGVAGRELLDRLEVPQPWRGTIDASLELIDDLERRIAQINTELRGGGADRPYVRLLLTVPGIGWVLAFTIAAEIGDITRFPSAKKLCGYTGLCPRVHQSGERDRRGPLTKQGPEYLRWALLEATMHALRHPAYNERYQRNKQRLGKQRGAKVAQIDVARKLTEAIWHMLTNNELRADTIDLAFITRPADPDDDGLQLRVVSREPLVAVLAPDHRLARRKRVGVPLLAGETIVTFPEGATIRARLEDAAARAGYAPRVAFETNEVGRMRALAAAGLAIAVLPRSDAERPGPPIAAVPFQEPEFEHIVYMAFRATRHHSPAAQAFIDVVRTVRPQD